MRECKLMIQKKINGICQSIALTVERIIFLDAVLKNNNAFLSYTARSKVLKIWA